MTRIGILLAMLLVVGCEDEPSAGGGRPGGGFGGFPPTLVVTYPAEYRSIADIVEAVGTTAAMESVTLTAKVTDTIRQVRFEDGDFVDSGAVLVELTNLEETAMLAEAEANVIDARNQHDRVVNLFEQRTVPISDVDEAKARLSGATARYQAIIARLDDRLIRAPFAGLLGFREVSEGTLITPGTAITTIDDVSTVKLDFPIPEIHLGSVTGGLSLTAESPAFPGRVFNALIRTVGSRVDPVTRAVVVRAHIDNQDLLLRPGMLMTVRLTKSNRQALMVPETALLQRGTEAFVYTVNEQSKAQMVPIDLGIRRGGWAEVRSGLEAGEAVITEGVIKVRNGAQVREGGTNPQGGPGRAPQSS